MTTTPFKSLTDDWDASNQYVAAADTDVLLGNVGSAILRWTTTSDATPPVIGIDGGQTIKPFEARPMTLRAGTVLWLAGHYTVAALEI